MSLVQLLLTDEQAELVAAALRDAEQTLIEERADRGGVEVTSEQVAEHERLAGDITAVGRLGMLFQDASENPLKYKPSPRMDAVKSIVKAGKVPVPKSRRKKRAGRHQRRRAERRMFRRDREMVEGYNKAVELYEKDAAEHAANVAEIEERVKDQPRFTITDGFGNTLADVPAEFIKDAEGNTPLLKPAIHVVR